MAGALIVRGVPVEVPAVSAAEARAVFSKLCKEFKIDEKVGKHLVEEKGLETLGDFCGFFSHESEVETKLLGKSTDLERRGLQTSRVRQAWHACCSARDAGDLRRRRGADETDLDQILPDKDLQALRGWPSTSGTS